MALRCYQALSSVKSKIKADSTRASLVGIQGLIRERERETDREREREESLALTELVRGLLSARQHCAEASKRAIAQAADGRLKGS
jgi:hypothetical protein